MRRVVAPVAVKEVSEWRKSPSVIVETCEADSGDHAPIECGWLRANCLTLAGGRRAGVAPRRARVAAPPLSPAGPPPAPLSPSGFGVSREVGAPGAPPPPPLVAPLVLRGA